MDLQLLLQELKEHHARIERAIAQLEDLQGNAVTVPKSPPGRRGRRSMGLEERQKVSERMKKVWANRRNPRTRRDPLEVPT